MTARDESRVVWRHERRFDGPDCGVDGCEREVGHIGQHARSEPMSAAEEAEWRATREPYGNPLVRSEPPAEGLREAVREWAAHWSLSAEAEDALEAILAATPPAEGLEDARLYAQQEQEADPGWPPQDS